MTKTLKIKCRECGEACEAKKDTKLYCSAACRMKFNNRRRERGAELYDLFMAVRYDRANARDKKLWSVLCKMAELQRDEDFRDRDGRQSWLPANEVLADRPDLFAQRSHISIGRKA